MCFGWEMNQIECRDCSHDWKAAIHKDGWVLAHNAIRGELNDFQYVLTHMKYRTTTPKYAESIRKWWKGHAEHIHGHHSNEDDILNPFIRTRVEYPEKLEEDHTCLIKCMQEIESCIHKKPIDIEQLSNLWNNYVNYMNPHLWEEERIGIPLVRKHFTPKEFDVPLQQILRKATLIELGSFIHYNGGKKHIMKFMKQERIPSFVWYFSFRFALKYYKKHMIKPLEFLKYQN